MQWLLMTWRSHESGHKRCVIDLVYSDVMMSPMASQITSLRIVYSTVYSGADHSKHQSSASLAFVRGIHRWPANSPQKRPVMWKMFLFDDVTMTQIIPNPVQEQVRSISYSCMETFFFPIQLTGDQLSRHWASKHGSTNPGLIVK